MYHRLAIKRKNINIISLLFSLDGAFLNYLERKCSCIPSLPSSTCSCISSYYCGCSHKTPPKHVLPVSFLPFLHQPIQRFYVDAGVPSPLNGILSSCSYQSLQTFILLPCSIFPDSSAKLQMLLNGTSAVNNRKLFCSLFPDLSSIAGNGKLK